MALTWPAPVAVIAIRFKSVNEALFKCALTAMLTAPWRNQWMRAPGSPEAVFNRRFNSDTIAPGLWMRESLLGSPNRYDVKGAPSTARDAIQCLIRAIVSGLRMVS